MAELAVSRHGLVRCGKKLEYFIIVWNSLEGLVAVLAGIFAGSISPVAFGENSFIEVSVILLVGLLLNAVFGLWWADPLGGLLMVPIILREGVQAVRERPCCP